jgi:hypothetical protein
MFEDLLNNVSKVDVYMLIILNGIFTGLGVSIGAYFANNHLIKKVEKLHKRIKRKGINGWLVAFIYICIAVAIFSIIKSLWTLFVR